MMNSFQFCFSFAFKINLRRYTAEWAAENEHRAVESPVRSWALARLETVSHFDPRMTISIWWMTKSIYHISY